jgi:hypothetical protein
MCRDGDGLPRRLSLHGWLAPYKHRLHRHNDIPDRDAPGVWQIGLFALPLMMTGENVRDIGAGVGQWAQQEANGAVELGSAGGE